jgi:predicted nucleic acid-binding protein
MTIVVDASVAIKWYLAEEDWEMARGLLAGADQVTAPELVVVEVSNAAWKAYRRGFIAAEQQALIAGDIVQVFDRLEPLSSLAVRASAIAREIDHPVYDCFYLALSEAKDARLVTSDERLLAKTNGTAFAAGTTSLRAYKP